jgi:hypothetical protein
MKEAPGWSGLAALEERTSIAHTGNSTILRTPRKTLHEHRVRNRIGRGKLLGKFEESFAAFRWRTAGDGNFHGIACPGF